MRTIAKIRLLGPALVAAGTALLAAGVLTATGPGALVGLGSPGDDAALLDRPPTVCPFTVSNVVPLDGTQELASEGDGCTEPHEDPEPDPCTENPEAEECQDDPCEEDPQAQGCEPDCEENPDAEGCDDDDDPDEPCSGCGGGGSTTTTTTQPASTTTTTTCSGCGDFDDGDSNGSSGSNDSEGDGGRGDSGDGDSDASDRSDGSEGSGGSGGSKGSSDDGDSEDSAGADDGDVEGSGDGSGDEQATTAIDGTKERARTISLEVVPGAPMTMSADQLRTGLVIWTLLHGAGAMFIFSRRMTLVVAGTRRRPGGPDGGATTV